MSNSKKPCDICAANNKPNCGNDWCHTRSKNEKEWIVDCSVCSGKNKVTWKQAVNKGCPVCCSFKVSIYHAKEI